MKQVTASTIRSVAGELARHFANKIIHQSADFIVTEDILIEGASEALRGSFKEEFSKQLKRQLGLIRPNIGVASRGPSKIAGFTVFTITATNS